MHCIDLASGIPNMVRVQSVEVMKHTGYIPSLTFPSGLIDRHTLTCIFYHYWLVYQVPDLEQQKTLLMWEARDTTG